MLQNPKWITPTVQPSIYSLANLIEWLESKPPRRRYNYHNATGKCLFGQYMAAHDIPWDTQGWADLNACYIRLALRFATVAECRPYTFGAALKRARYLQTLDQLGTRHVG